MKDRDFIPANQIFMAVLKELQHDGLDQMKHKPVIEQEDIQKMYQTNTLSKDNPTSIQRKVFFELLLHSLIVDGRDLEPLPRIASK